MKKINLLAASVGVLSLLSCASAGAESYLDEGATFEICADISNEIRALDLLVDCGVIPSYEVDESGTPINLPKRIHLVDESLLVSSLADYDYGVIPCNTALTGKLKAEKDLPSESDEVADLRANILAHNAAEFASNAEYRNKIAVLTEALLSQETASFIEQRYSGVIKVEQGDLRPIKEAAVSGSGVIKVCASENPHKEILESSAVRNYVESKGYTLSVTVLDWTMQNEAVAAKDYDANYFQHRPYLQTYNEHFDVVEPSAKVHFEPLRLYRGRGK